MKKSVNTSYIYIPLLLSCFYFLVPFNATAEEITVPTINVSPDIYYPLDETLYLEGRSKVNSNVQIQFTKQGAKNLRFVSKSDPNGEWVLAEKIPLESGDWEVRARLLAGADKVSEWSNPRIFKVIVNGITVGGVNIKFAFFFFVFIILIFVGGLAAWYFAFRIKNLKSILLTKEVREAQGSVKKGISEIRRDLTEELPNRKKEHVIRELDQLEEGMEREIKDIEEKL